MSSSDCPSLSSAKFRFHLAVKKSRRERCFRFYHIHYFSHVDKAAIAAAIQRVFDMLNSKADAGAAESATETSMVMPGFGRTPVRQLRVTDSPFPEAKGCEEEAQVSKAAAEFIRRFYGDLRRQKSFESPSYRIWIN